MIDPWWILTVASIIGVVANIHKKSWCFYIWAFTNSAWFIYDLSLKAYPQAALFAVYIALAFYGIYEWEMKKRED